MRACVEERRACCPSPWPRRSRAGTLRGRVEVVDKGGKRATDLADAVVWVEGPRVTPPASSATDRDEGQGLRARAWRWCRWAAPSSSRTRTRSSTTCSRSPARTASTSTSTRSRRAAPGRSEHPGLVRVYCNIHPQMSAFVLVRDNPFWARRRRRRLLRDRRTCRRAAWVLKAWHERSGEAAQAGHRARGGARSTSPLDPRRLELEARAATRTSSARTTRPARGTEEERRLPMGLTGKILLFIAALVVLLVGGTLAFTTVQADRLARATIDAGLKETRDVWQAIQADRFNKLKLGVRVLANDPYFKAALAERDQATTLDSLGERGQDLERRLHDGDRPGGRAGGPHRPALGHGRRPLRPTRSCGARSRARTRRRCGGRATSSSPRSRCRCRRARSWWACWSPGYGINEAVASQIRKLTHSEIAFLVAGRRVSRRASPSPRSGPREPALAAALSRPELAGARDGALRDRPRRATATSASASR